MDCSMPGFPVHHQLLELAKTHIHLSWWCQLTILSCCPLLLLPSIFPSIRSFPVSHFFTSGGQSNGVSASVLPVNIQDWFPLELTGLISVQSKGLSRVFSSTTVQKHQFFLLSLLYDPTLTSIPDYWKNHSFDDMDFCQQRVFNMVFNMLSRLVIAFLVRRKHLLISWLQSPSAVILEPKRRKSITASTFSPSVCHEVMGPDAIILVFWMLSFKPAFSFFFSPSSRGSLVSLHFLPLEWYHLRIWDCWYFSWQSYFQLITYPAQHLSWCALHIS